MTSGLNPFLIKMQSEGFFQRNRHIIVIVSLFILCQVYTIISNGDSQFNINLTEINRRDSLITRLDSQITLLEYRVTERDTLLARLSHTETSERNDVLDALEDRFEDATDPEREGLINEALNAITHE